jgi:outer membrane protein assembly factor BamB
MTGTFLHRRGRHARRKGFPFLLVGVAIVLATVAVAEWRFEAVSRLLGLGVPDAPLAHPVPPDPSATPRVVDPADRPGSGTEPLPAPGSGDQPLNASFPGIVTFRGNATRTYYGEGPVPLDPEILWNFPLDAPMCLRSEDPAEGELKVWCGIGWTGQPNVIVREDGTVEVRVGGFDGRYHFLDGESGRALRPALVTGDLAKGSATSDPDGFPLYYAGSRDNLFRIVALDREQPKVLWSMHAETSVPEPVWNDDWDGAALVVGDYLLVGGENSWFYVIELGRDYNPRGRVTVDPGIVMAVPSFDDDLREVIDDERFSIENSIAYLDGVAYFANSAGLVQGWDISDILTGGSNFERVFRFWAGDDVDATIIIDDQGYLYVAVEQERFTGRADQVGQLMKLDPLRPDDPVMWSFFVPEKGEDGTAGLFSTPALHGEYLYVTSNAGDLIAVNRETGEEAWRIGLAGPTWSSPVVVDDVLIVGDCDGVLRGYDVSRPGEEPPELWSLQLNGCIEATPAVWDGRIYVGTRNFDEGGLYAIGDAP